VNWHFDTFNKFNTAAIVSKKVAGCIHESVAALLAKAQRRESIHKSFLQDSKSRVGKSHFLVDRAWTMDFPNRKSDGKND
jgi:hypothetical protein